MPIPITIPAIADNFDSVMRFAREKKIPELTAIINQTGSVNFTYGFERPIERLAFQGEIDAVELLLIRFQGDYDYAVRGFARANNKAAVDRLLRSGADINFAVMGYAMAGNLNNRVDKLIARGASSMWAIGGYAQAGDPRVDALIGPRKNKYTREHLWVHALSGYAYGGHLKQLEALFEQYHRKSPCRREALQTIITVFAAMNKPNDIHHWRTRVSWDEPQNIAIGFARGGRLVELQTHLARYPTPDYLPMIMETLSANGYILQARQYRDYFVTNQLAVDKYAERAITGYICSGQISEILQLSEQAGFNMQATIESMIRNYKFYMLQALYNKFPTEDTFKLIAKALAETFYYDDKLKCLRVWTEIQTPALRNVFLETINNIPECAKKKKIVDDSSKKLTYNEVNSELPDLMNKYLLTRNQARFFQQGTLDIFAFLMQILPGLQLIKHLHTNTALLVARFLIPTWSLQPIENYRNLSRASGMEVNEILDFANKIFAGFHLSTSIRKKPASDIIVSVDDHKGSDDKAVTPSAKQNNKKRLMKTDASYNQNAAQFFELLVSKTLFAKNTAIVITVEEEKPSLEPKRIKLAK